MSNITLILIFFILPLSLCSQEFSFTMRFVDAAGHKDSIVVGYDMNATDSIDEAFGEKNIIDRPWDSIFDVRISNDWSSRRRGFTSTQSKIQIVKNNCNSFFSITAIDIYSKSWPVTAIWDKNLFIDSCNKFSLYTSVSPGGWWDTGSPSNLYIQFFKDRDSISFNSYSRIGLNPNYSYINNRGDTVSYFWQIFAKTNITVETQDIFNKNKFIVYPNPASDILHFQYSPTFRKLKSVNIYSITGQQMMTSKITDQVDISSLNPGLNILIAFNERGSNITSKFVKK